MDWLTPINQALTSAPAWAGTAAFVWGMLSI